ncbi:MAG TPA: dTDP-4-dehydrorhamnose reductase [Geobacterales bacterium]|nr:dTDP-4-dehydrorhamnose reductase [Geobacterales bacterium]
MILVVGANGMLGKDLMATLAGEVRGVDLADIDITSPESVQRVITTLRPRVIINAAAYTDVDGCETNQEQAFAVNGEGVANLALAARDMGSLLVQISTDYLFDGSKGSPYLEDDLINPLSIYGQSKMAGEMNCRVAPEHLIIRTQWLYGLQGKNFVETMLKLSTERDELAVVDDQIGAPTWTRELCRAIVQLIDKGCRGTYHAAASGSCSWYQFANAIFEEAGVKIRVKPLTTKELGRPAARPAHSVLDCGKLAADTGIQMVEWRQALRGYLQERGQRSKN